MAGMRDGEDGMEMIETAVREVLAARAHLSATPASLGVDDDLFDRGLTSLATVEVMLALEERLGVEFPDEALTRSTFRSVGSLVEALSRLGAAA